MNNSLLHPIRAQYDADTIVIYQAYSDAIGQAAAHAGTLDVPGFLKTRMTWIKPSFLWMMYRCGWGDKDAGQSTVLRITMTRAGFMALLDRAALSSFYPETGQTHEGWKAGLARRPNRIQWDPDRDMDFAPLNRRAIQVGIAAECLEIYFDAIRQIEDITPMCQQVRDTRDLTLCPVEGEIDWYWGQQRD